MPRDRRQPHPPRNCPGGGRPPASLHAWIRGGLNGYDHGYCARCGKLAGVRRSDGMMFRHAPVLPLYEPISWRAS